MAIDFLDGHIRYYKSIYAIVISSIWYYKKWICYMCSCVLYYIYTHSDIIRTHSKVTWILNLCPGWESALSWMHLLRGGRWEASPATKLDTTLKDLPTRVMDMFMYGGYGYGYGYVMDMVMIPHLWLYMEVSIVMGVPPERWMFFSGTYHENLDDLGISIVQEPPIWSCGAFRKMGYPVPSSKWWPWLSIATHGDFGIHHFKNPPIYI